MTRKIPIIPTIIVAASIAVMVALGFWQLGRSQWKDELLAQYAAASSAPKTVTWPATPDEAQKVLFQLSSFNCAKVISMRSTAGDSASGQKGFAHIALCELANGKQGEVTLGWTKDLAEPQWEGGMVSGMIASGPRLIAEPAQAGLDEVARPDPADVPNNHLAYAGQWFFFALTALIIYVLALGARNRGKA